MNPKPWESAIWRTAFVEYLQRQKQSDIVLNSMLRDAAVEVQRQIASLQRLDGIGAATRRRQYEAAFKEIKQNQKTLWSDIQTNTQNTFDAVGSVAVNALDEVVEHLSTTLEKAGYSVAQQFELAAKQGVELAKARALNAIELSPLVYKNEALMTGKLEKVINNGLIANKSAAEIAKDAKEFISPTTPGGVDFSAKRLARTEINNAFHATSVLAVQDQPWIDGVKWNLSGSHPKPDRCNDYAGQDGYGKGPGVFPAGKVPGKPHPMCLCYTTTITVSDDDFVKAFQSGKYNKYL